MNAKELRELANELRRLSSNAQGWKNEVSDPSTKADIDEAVNTLEAYVKRLTNAFDPQMKVQSLQSLLATAEQTLAVAPPGMEDVVKELKTKDVENPWAVAWSIYNKKHKKKSAAGRKLSPSNKMVKCKECGKLTHEDVMSRGLSMCRDCIEDAEAENAHMDECCGGPGECKFCDAENGKQAAKKLNMPAIRRWMKQNLTNYIDSVGEVNATGLAEEAAQVFDAYLDTQDYEIPTEIFDMAADLATDHEKSASPIIFDNPPEYGERGPGASKEQLEVDQYRRILLKSKGKARMKQKPGGDTVESPIKVSDLQSLLTKASKTLKNAAETQGAEDFIELLKSKLKLNGRQIHFRNKSTLGGERYDNVYITFINLPEGVGGAGGGAEAENNRLSISINGFGKESPHSPPPSGKVKAEESVNALGREHRMRAKSGTPEQVAKYLADFLNNIAANVEPRYTHTQPPEKSANERRKG